MFQEYQYVPGVVILYLLPKIASFREVSVMILSGANVVGSSFKQPNKCDTPSKVQDKCRTMITFFHLIKVFSISWKNGCQGKELNHTAFYKGVCLHLKLLNIISLKIMSH